jgi:hypothetical protein
MPANPEQHTAFITLAAYAFAQQAYAPNDAILMAAAKNLARLQTPKDPSAGLTSNLRFDELLKSLAYV